jgi:hypothetical protein
MALLLSRTLPVPRLHPPRAGACPGLVTASARPPGFALSCPGVTQSVDEGVDGSRGGRSERAGLPDDLPAHVVARRRVRGGPGPAALVVSPGYSVCWMYQKTRPVSPVPRP